MKRIPDIRLKGFEGKWKESVLKDELSDDIKTNTLARAFLSDSDGEVLNVHYGDVLIKYGSLLNATEDDIPHITGSTTKDYCDFLQNGDVIFADTAEDETAGKCVEIENVGDKKIVSGLHTIACRPKEQFGEGYLGYYLNSPKYHDQLLPLLQGIKVFSLNKSQLEQTTMLMPQSVSEQQSIGSFFSSFDRFISEHQQRLENLRRVKKSMLQKMFPQQGQTVPEIRFKGFEGEWKENAIGNISDSFSGGTPSVGVASYYGGSIPFIRSGEINMDRTEMFITEKGLMNSSAKLVKKGTLLYALYGATSGEVSISKIDGAINQAILAIIPHKGFDGPFLCYWFKQNKKKIISTYLQGGQGNLSGDIVKKIHLLLPHYAEQRQIASFFTSLDNLITQEVKYIDQLNRVKRTLLQKMFV